MKKVITLLLAAGLVIGAASAANAVDIKAKGLWHNAMSFADRNFEKHNGSDKMQPFSPCVPLVQYGSVLHKQ